VLFAVPVLALVVFVMYSRAPTTTDAVNAPVVSVLEKKRVAPPQTAIETANVTALPLAKPKATSARVVPAPTGATVPAVVAQEKATVSFAISPWGEVFVDGKSVGVSPPLSSLKLEAGKHSVEIRNQAFAAYRDTVNLKPGQSLKVRHKFR